MLAFMWWIVIGLVAGLLARLIMPGNQPMGWVMTIMLGLLGSIVGGFLASMIFGTDPREPGFQTGGFIASTIGALILLALYGAYERRTTSRL
ncbi:MAG: GlsB/YeaQ/YmgE family stress response membrane protein [Pirellulales bacterium]|nr:GlsB/YeaQ/YmgE family stress response membrane protein [Pirellulales bacterium]